MSAGCPHATRLPSFAWTVGTGAPLRWVLAVCHPTGRAEIIHVDKGWSSLKISPIKSP